MVIDTANRMLYLGASSSAQIDLFVEYFVKTFHFEPIQINPEYYSESEFGKHADELPVIEFSTRADGETVPGRDFLTWLWYFSEQEFFRTGDRGYAGDSGSRRMYIHD